MLVAESEDPCGVDEETGHDRRHGTHGVDDGAQRLGETTFHLVEIDGRGDSEWHGNEAGDADLLKGSDDRMSTTTLGRVAKGTDIALVLREELHAQCVIALSDHVAHDQHQRHDGERRSTPHQNASQVVFGPDRSAHLAHGDP